VLLDTGMHSAVGALVAFSAGKESPLPQRKKLNRQQKDSSPPMVINCVLFVYATYSNQNVA